MIILVSLIIVVPLLNCNHYSGNGIWDIEEYRTGAVNWCRFITDITEIDKAYKSMLTVRLLYL